MYASSVIARGKAALQGSETEQRIAVLLYDDAVQVISSFELNQLASLTYHEAQVITSADRDMTDIILEHLEQIMKAPANYSTVSVQKSLVVAKHILLHGAEKIVQPIRMQLGRYVEQLTQYNTVLLAQQQTGGAWLMRLKGGSVDYGGPVREVAVALHNLLQSPQQLQFERRVSADPNSLVPVGDKQRVAFATDEVRLQHLKKQMEEQQRIITKSNLQKATDGFGSGYMAKDGKTVVGAAHGIEEMLQQQQREEQKFRDEAKARQQRQQQQEGVGGYSEYQAPSFSQAPTYGINNTISRQEAPQPPQEADLIGFDQHPSPAAAAAPEMDLLDFGSTANATTTTAPPQHEEDLLFGGSETYTSTATSHHHHDPFTTAAAAGPIHATSTTADDNNNANAVRTTAGARRWRWRRDDDEAVRHGVQARKARVVGDGCWFGILLVLGFGIRLNVLLSALVAVVVVAASAGSDTHGSGAAFVKLVSRLVSHPLGDAGAGSVVGSGIVEQRRVPSTATTTRELAELL